MCQQSLPFPVLTPHQSSALASRTKFLSFSLSLSIAAASCSSSRAHSSSPSISNQCRSFSFSSTFRSVSRWSHDVDWKSPVTLTSSKGSPDFTGVPAVVDLACMCDAMNKLGNDSNKINPLVPVDLVIDHSVQVDVARTENAVQANMGLEFQRNKERFAFLKWGSNAFQNMLVVPPAFQVNLEYLGHVVFNTDGMLYPDSVVGIDSHTTMIDGLGVAGWGVGGIEAEAAMLGQYHKHVHFLLHNAIKALNEPMSMVLPGVVVFELSGKLRNGVTATYLVLTVTQMLRNHGVVGKFVEFHGEGVGKISLADRASIANMSLEYGATMGFFPVDNVT
ncbi:hypothetical protein TEA_014339 [Camellia sinensis var. sinensis]|uniref:Aconitase/3-isopropylmalate dehydratase large subunit alpha/beta/alpha domain-containing protein n=1 Tax=Camellia sinensis var. sinensis TaxID=542762 RepID=A0A4S4D064_CAMSN|nr:hypothetical protein TEA_014339 [Camellia sinensis var. sinensis]